MLHPIVPVCYCPTTTLILAHPDSPYGKENDALNNPLIRHFPSSGALFHWLDDLNVARPKSPSAESINPCQLIYEDIFYPDRFSEISVILMVDGFYGLDPLTCCEHLNTHPMKKIYITRKENESKALAMLEDGLIHEYIILGMDQMPRRILKAIERQQWRYFQDMSRRILTLLSMPLPAPLNSDVFKQFYQNIINLHEIREHYLMKKSGCLLLLDADGKTSLLEVVEKNHTTTKLDGDLTYQYHPDFTLEREPGKEIISYHSCHPLKSSLDAAEGGIKVFSS